MPAAALPGRNRLRELGRTHNVLCEQVRRDITRLGILDPLLHRVRSRLALLDGAEDARTTADALDRLEPALRAAAADSGGSLHFRGHLGLLTSAVQATCLLDEAADDAAAGIASPKTEVAAFFVRRHLALGYDPAEDPSYLARIDAVLT